MDASATLADLLTQLGSAAGLPGLNLDDQGHASVCYNQTLTLHLQARAADFLLYATVGSLPATDSLETAQRLLRANFMWEQTCGATLSLAGEGLIILAQAMSVQDLDFPSFQEKITAFVQTGTYWREQLQPSAQTACSDQPSESDGLPGFAIRA